MPTLPELLHCFNFSRISRSYLTTTAAESDPRSSPNLCRPVVFGVIARSGVRMIDGVLGLISVASKVKESLLDMKEIERSKPPWSPRSASRIKDIRLRLRAVWKRLVIICVVERILVNDLWPTRSVVLPTSQTIRGPMNHHWARYIPPTSLFFRSRPCRARHPVWHLRELRLG